MRIIQSFGQEDRSSGGFRSVNEENRAANMEAASVRSLYFPLVEVIGSLGVGLVLWFGGAAILRGDLTVGVLVAFVLYLFRFFEPGVSNDDLAAYWEEWQPHVIVQPYLDAIESTGDLRILTINDTILGSVLRVPAEGSRLANLHQGAVAARLEPTPRQIEACKVVAKDLNPLGLYLLGLDFIGEHLTEVNFTSPTTIVQVNRVNGIRADIVLVDELERMWRERVSLSS